MNIDTQRYGCDCKVDQDGFPLFSCKKGGGTTNVNLIDQTNLY